MRRLVAGTQDFDSALAELRTLPAHEGGALAESVAAIIADVRLRGDAALLEYTNRFDRRQLLQAAELEIGAAALETAFQRLDADVREALTLAADRIGDFHRRQKREGWQFEDALGNVLAQRVLPLDRVGIYVPGGKASYPSSVLMNALPARVAGVAEIVMAVPAPAGVLSDAVLAAAHLAGVQRVFTMGGAQAVAALALGTQSVPRVDKIVGPGNAWVAEAKRQLFGEVGIDMIAGPSEVVIVCDAGSDPAWIAFDLFSQAEHDEQAQAILISTEQAVLDAVDAEIRRLLPTMERHPVISRSLATRGAMIRVRDLAEAVDVCNRIAPEHLELAVDDPQALLPALRHAGAVFLGRYTPEALGDYCAGPSHVLPTAGTARFFSPLGVDDFQKRMSVIGCSTEGAAVLGRVAATLAYAEGLQAHASSALARCGTGESA